MEPIVLGALIKGGFELVKFLFSKTKEAEEKEELDTSEKKHAHVKNQICELYNDVEITDQSDELIRETVKICHEIGHFKKNDIM